MGKRIFWIFILLISATTAGAIAYLQSSQFAEILKTELKAKVPKSSGLALEFDRLTVGIFPPSISLTNVDLEVTAEKNLLGLARPTRFEIGKLGIAFKMLQAFSRGVKINKVFLSNAKIQVALPAHAGSSLGGGVGDDISKLAFNPILVNLDRNLQLHVQQLEARDSEFSMIAYGAAGSARYAVQKVNYVSLIPDFGRAAAVLDVEGVTIHKPGMMEVVENIKLNMELTEQRLKIYSLDLRRRREAAHVEGELLGSIRSPEKFSANINVIGRANLSDLGAQIKELKGMAGGAVADLQVRGVLERPEVLGRVEIGDFKYGLWDIEKVEVRGKWQKSGVNISGVAISNRGGKISMDQPLDIPLPMKEINAGLSLDLNKVSLQEFAGNIKSDINNLRAEISGKLGVELKLAVTERGAHMERLRFLPEVRIEKFELNNQTYGKSKPYQRIFLLQPFDVSGALLVESGSLKIENLGMRFSTGLLKVSGGVDKSNAYDISGTAQEIDLGKEMGDIAGIALTGHGGIGIHVHGVGESVLFDFDLKQREAKFVTFDFGELGGRVTLDDKNNRILLKDLQGKKNSSTYQANGFVDIGADDDDLNIDLQFNDANPDDIFSVFAHQLKEISWLPRGMTGAVSVSSKVGGGYADGLASLKINANVSGQRLFYKGEGLTEFSAQAGVDRGVIFAKNVTGKKYNSRFHGEITYFPNDELKYQIDVPSGKIRDWDYFTGLDFPMDGEWRISSRGSGKWETLRSETDIQVFQAFVRTRPVPSFSIKILTDSEKATAEIVTDDKVIAASYLSTRGKGGGQSALDVSVRGSDFSYLLCSVNRRSCSDPSLELMVSGDLHAKWLNDQWRSANGGGQISRASLSRRDFSLGIKSPARFSLQAGMFDLAPVEIFGDSSNLVVSGRHALGGSARNWKFTGLSSLKVLEFVTPLIEEARGAVNINASIGGAAQDLKLDGSMKIGDGFMRLGGLDAPLEGLSGILSLRGAELNIRELIGRIGGGDVRATGGIRFFTDKAPKMDLELFLSNNRLRFFPVNYAEFDGARLSFSGDAPPYLFSGTAKVKKVLMKKNFDVGGAKKQRTARYLPEALSKKSSIYEVKIKAIAERGVFVENDLLNAEFRGDLMLLNNFESPQITARAELVKGRLLFRNTSFNLDHVILRVPDPEVFNPQFSLGGAANVAGYKIGIFATGSAESPKISFSSNPALSQEDILSLLAFGYTGEEAKKVSSTEKSALTYTEVGSVLLEQLRISQDLESKGVKVIVAPSISESESNIIRPKSTATAAPKVYLQTKILNNLEASLGSTFGSTQTNELDASLEYRLGKRASVNAVYEQEPGVQANEPRRSYGTDIKFRWGFK